MINIYCVRLKDRKTFETNAEALQDLPAQGYANGWNLACPQAAGLLLQIMATLEGWTYQTNYCWVLFCDTTTAHEDSVILSWNLKWFNQLNQWFNQLRFTTRVWPVLVSNPGQWPRVGDCSESWRTSLSERHAIQDARVADPGIDSFHNWMWYIVIYCDIIMHYHIIYICAEQHHLRTVLSFAVLAWGIHQSSDGLPTPCWPISNSFQFGLAWNSLRLTWQPETSYSIPLVTLV